jgi:membrane-associated protein
MEYKTFVSYNVFGGLLWVFLTVLGGYFLGSIIPNVGKYLHLIIVLVILTSFIPFIFEYYKHRKAS